MDSPSIPLPDPQTLAVLIQSRLQALPDIGQRIYDGYVPKAVPEAGGFIRPYVVLFSGIGSDLPEERNLTKLADPTVLDLTVQTQCVAPTPGQCRQIGHQVRSALLNMRVGGGWLLPDTGFTAPEPLADTTITPARFFLPIRWRLLTT